MKDTRDFIDNLSDAEARELLRTIRADLRRIGGKTLLFINEHERSVRETARDILSDHFDEELPAS